MSFNLKRLSEDKGDASASSSKDFDKKPPLAKDDKPSESKPKSEKPKGEKPKNDGGEKSRPTRDFGRREDNEPREISDDIKLISGPQLMSVLKDILPMMDKLQGGVGPLDKGPLEFGDDDLAGDDMVNDSFKGIGGCDGVVKIIKLDGGNAKDIIEQIINHLGNVRRAERQKLLRLAFADIHRFMKGDVTARALAVQRIANVMVDAPSGEFSFLMDAMKGLTQDDVRLADAAAYRVKHAYVQTLPENHNVRVAYTMLSTTDGEPVQFCPKAAKQIGYAVAMEVSKCRDNCIDSTVSADGRIGCAYAKWMKVSKDNFELLKDRYEVVPHKLNENLMTLAAGDRGKKDEYGYEKMLEDAKSRKEGFTPSESTESSLSNPDQPNKYYNHQKSKTAPKRPQDIFNKKAAKGSPAIDAYSDENLGVQVDKGNAESENDETMAQMLADEHSNLTDKDLDWLEQRLEKYRDGD